MNWILHELLVADFNSNIVTRNPIARQRVGKQIFAKRARKNRTSLAERENIM
jgi:hypothetical protein